MEATSAQVKLTIARLIEIAYSTDKGLTTKIVLSKGPFKITVDENGNAMLSGKAGALVFSGAPALNKIGVNIGAMNANFWTEGEDKKVHYTVSYGIKYCSATIGGQFDIEELITSCSGLLCQAARALKGFDAANDARMQQIMGQ